MEKEIMESFFSAVESAGIKNFELITDTAYTHYYNNDRSIVKYKDGKILGLKKEPKSGTPAYGESQIVVYTSDDAHICEARLGGTFEQIKQFVQDYGFSLDADEMKILVNLNYGNSKLIPPTGDYYKFDELPEEEYNKLTPEEKEEYNKAKADYDTHHIKNPGFVGRVN